MAGFDNRKKSEAEQSFYVVDDLRYKQNEGKVRRNSFDIYRFDTLQEAIDKFKEIPEFMTPALGMHLSERSELDLVHRREGENVLVTDFFNFPKWRTNENVLSAVKDLCEEFNIEWQMNSRLVTYGTILIPLERNIVRVPDKVFDDKNLASKPTPFSNHPNPLSAINEAYVEGRGWLPFADVSRAAESFGYNNPQLLKITQFNINYKDNRGYLGQSDISPFDLQILEERHAIRFGPESTRNTALRKLAEELDEFGEDFDHYDYHDGIENSEEHIDSLVAALSEGKVHEIVAFLRDIGEDNEEFSARALNLASRVQGVVSHERKQSLDAKINEAAEKTTSQNANTQERQTPEPEL